MRANPFPVGEAYGGGLGAYGCLRHVCVCGCVWMWMYTMLLLRAACCVLRECGEVLGKCGTGRGRWRASERANGRGRERMATGQRRGGGWWVALVCVCLFLCRTRRGAGVGLLASWYCVIGWRGWGSSSSFGLWAARQDASFAFFSSQRHVCLRDVLAEMGWDGMGRDGGASWCWQRGEQGNLAVNS
ncbi:hypothetical protein K505DRAFT_133189 [Melanomma pulvis-pyrius CBS 109.77]|uniref:Uncharacterized protein n=1 Tax=Melanomma pulvis-pyrius CBS 109.77 TaxID=1314802 RepID=A0A6A6WSK7_9PLEO|nr:hypothetical protein K505DRAFT_133189 [Melanomma pulvis-pyrius CBS 109.77]